MTANPNSGQPRGAFNIPRRPGSSTNGARTAYREAFGTEWNCDDDYLRELAREATERGFLSRKSATHDFVQWMRENDDIGEAT